MSFDRVSATDRAACVAAFSADLTDAAYSILLRHRVGGSWIDLQLEVWRALAATVEESDGKAPAGSSGTEFNIWREILLARATDAAYRVALRHELREPFLELELDLQETLRKVVERHDARGALRKIHGAGVRVVADAVLSRMELRSKRDSAHRISSRQPQ